MGRFQEAGLKWEQLVRTLDDAVRLSTLRYKGGLDSYLQVLDSQRNLFAGELTLARLRLALVLLVVIAAPGCGLFRDSPPP